MVLPNYHHVVMSPLTCRVGEKIGTDTAENERNFADSLTEGLQKISVQRFFIRRRLYGDACLSAWNMEMVASCAEQI